VKTCVAAALLVLVVANCGGQVKSGEGPVDAGGSDASASVDAGWTQCSAPSGAAVCLGPANCPSATPECGLCEGVSGSSELVACETPALSQLGGRTCAQFCPDGSICVEEINSGGAFICAPFDLGVLFAMNGAADRVRYADMGAWTGAPIPAPDSCATASGITLCGGNCGGCPPAETCTGRAPLHPYGFCAPPNMHGCSKQRPSCADGSLSCFTFSVEASVQKDADATGLCVPTALCMALAAGLPGGGTCTFQ
jgi:hypothetical protein